MTHALIQHAHSLHHRLTESAASHESQRRVDPGLWQEICAEGYGRMLAPAERGGLQVDVATYVETLEALALGDAATAWCAMTAATTGMLTAYLPEPGARTLLEDGKAAFAGVFAPMGKATVVDGGYRLSGRWSFCSGCENAAWRTGGALVMTDAGPRSTASGGPEVRSFFFPAHASEVLDTWKVAGLSGTGSHDIAVKDLFVPDALTTCLTEDRPVEGALFRVPPFAVLALGVASVALGIARSALDGCVAQSKAPRTMGKPRCADSHVQMELLQAEAELRSARAFMMQSAQDVMRTAEHGQEIPLPDRALLRMAASHATSAAASVVDRAYNAGGGGAIYLSNPLQRHHRDIHTVTQHVMVGPGASKLTARAWLGLPGDFAML